MSIRELVKSGLAEKFNREYQKALAARQVSYEEWITAQESGGAERPGREIAAAEASASGTAGGQPQFCVFYSGRGRLADCALNEIGRYFKEHPEAMIVYGDEDVEAECRRSPWFKPDWSPDTFLAFFYFGSVTAVRRELLTQAEEQLEALGMEEGVRDWGNGFGPVREARYPEKEAWLRQITALVTLAGGFRKNCLAIQHLPVVLYHAVSGQAQQEVGEWKPEREESLKSPEAVSVIIPSKDNPEVLKCCLESLTTAGGGAAFEVIVVDNGSNDKNKEKYEKLIQDLTKTIMISYLYQPAEFNFSQMCNLGARTAKGSCFLFLNDDVELAEAGTLEQMAQKAVQPYTGAVGIKLCYPNSRTIQHDGITNLPMGPVHKLQFLDDGEAYAFGANRLNRNVLAVTGACLMVEKSRFWEAGGFPEELPVAFNDVDLCFSLFEKGYHNLVLNSVYGCHHESLSRGEDESAEKLARLLGERDKLYQRHPGLQGRDPYYALGWNREGLDTRIRPAYETAGNKKQALRPESAGRILENCREDACLLFRVEDCGNMGTQGYGVVLGDNNACYKKYLIWEKVNGEAPRIWLQELEGQFRPELIDNMPDQENVGLCGFALEWRENALPEGVYRLGMLARNRVTGLKLMNWSNRFLTVAGVLERQERK